MRARGLKLHVTLAFGVGCRSRPMRARGLKLVYKPLAVVELGRAPCGRVG